MTDRKVERPMKRMRMEVENEVVNMEVDDENIENPFIIPIPKFASTWDETYLLTDKLTNFIEDIVYRYTNLDPYNESHSHMAGKMIEQIFEIIIDNIKYILAQPEGYIDLDEYHDEYHDRNSEVYHFPIAFILNQSNDENLAISTIYKFMVDDNGESLDDEINEFVERLLRQILRQKTMTDN